ncbi:MAG: Quinone oxidoreductase, YhdH/YhfP family [Polyangiaceae bacterium]|jgi:acrylyl-CoA reductase (NADPH)|nr:Quinone oxidoreductase, YhdH/YhfP family [Polyangiaceae bacterium]
MFRAILIEKEADAPQRVSVQDLQDAALPPGDVTVSISHSTINYKDALALTGRSPIVRAFPMVPGIDFAGVVEDTADPAFRVGDTVIGNGFGIGESTWGGLAERARVPASGLVPLPSGLSPRDAMAIGTGGFTAMLSLMALEQHGITPERGPILVTGATGGVGSFSVSLLARLGYQVLASTGRLEESEYLKSLGATEVLARAELVGPGKPLAKERWAGVIDSVGSHTLANACAATMRGGSVAACGLAQGMDFPATVAPFILRGVNLLGIDSSQRPRSERAAAWNRLSMLAEPRWFHTIAQDIALEEAIPKADELLAGKIRGRLVVQVA